MTQLNEPDAHLSAGDPLSEPFKGNSLVVIRAPEVLTVSSVGVIVDVGFEVGVAPPPSPWAEWWRRKKMA